jgi:hypothetical protein
MRTNLAPEEWRRRRRIQSRIAEELKHYYRGCTTGELPPQLLALSKKLDQELLKKQEQPEVI